MVRLNEVVDKCKDNFIIGWLIQLVKFGLVGVSNTVISYGTYALLIWLDMHYLLASIIAFLISVFWSYMLNSRFVFKEDEGKCRVWWKVLIRTYISYAITGLVINNILLFVWIDKLALNKYFAYCINLLITFPLNFILNKFWAFQKKTT